MLISHYSLSQTVCQPKMEAESGPAYQSARIGGKKLEKSVDRESGLQSFGLDCEDQVLFIGKLE